MPADAWAVPLVVGEYLHSGAKRAPVEGNSSTPNLSVRGPMAGHSPGRIDDSLLVREAQRGNRAAFEELVRHYDQAVLRLAMHLTGSGHQAQDNLQEAVPEAVRGPGNLRL